MFKVESGESGESLNFLDDGWLNEGRPRDIASTVYRAAIKPDCLVKNNCFRGHRGWGLTHLHSLLIREQKRTLKELINI